MYINWHAHVHPPEEQHHPIARGRALLTIENVLEIHQQAGFDLCVVTDPVHYVKGRSNEEALKAMQRWDEYAAELYQKHSDRIVCFATTVPGGGEPFLREVERAIKAYGLKGVMINSSHNGHYPDEDEAEPFFDLVAGLDIPVMIHAPASSFGEDCMQMYRLISSVGRPADEMLAIARLITRGVFERHPDMKFVGAHLGGGICEVIGRMNYAYELGDDAEFLGPYEPRLISHPPLYYLRRMYMDSACYHPPALMCAIETVGVEHMLLGADAPPLIPLLPVAKRIVDELPLAEDEKEMIRSGNALKLLKMD